MNKLRQRLAVSSVVAVLVTVIPATSATAETETVFEDTTLTGDHSGTIYVAGDGITLDCDGYTVSAPGDTWGIYVTGNNVTVQDCHVTGFVVGITFQFVDGGTLINSSSFGNTNAGIRLHQSSNVAITATTSHGNGLSGFFLRGSDSNTITKADSLNNGGPGVLLFAGSDGNEIKNNHIESNRGVGISVDESDDNVIKANTVTSTQFASSVNNGKGIWLHNTSAGNRVVGNTSAGGNSQGFFLSDVHTNTLIDNFATDNSDGYLLQNADHSSLVGNTATANRNNGFALIIDSNGNEMIDNQSDANSLQGFVLVDSPDNVFSDNLADANDNGVLTIRSSGNEFRDNTASNNEFGGFVLVADSTENTLADNISLENGRDGFEVWTGTGNSLSGNAAEENGGHGIHLLQTANSRVTYNASVRNDRGIVVNESASNDVTGNQVRHNNFEGISVVNGSAENLVAHNTSRTNGLDLFQDLSSQGAGNSFEENAFRTSSGIE